MPKQWIKVQIADDAGVMQDAVAPIIISASRSTDVPAFYSKWLLNRLDKGYCTWTNPFNGKPQYVSLDKTRFMVFWTKNPDPMIPRLKQLDQCKFGYYFQFTLNDYDKEGYEPRLGPVKKRVECFKRLSDMLGPSRVIWRFDPLLLTNDFELLELLDRVETLMNDLSDYTRKIVFSFADLNAYRKVNASLKRSGVNAREFNEEEMNSAGKSIGTMAREYGLEAATCGEAIDLARYGVSHNRCIDDELIAELHPTDMELMSFLGREVGGGQVELFTAIGKGSEQKPGRLKDSGQREACGCIVSKDIGSYNTCPHLCVYCYANARPEAVSERYREHDPKGETI